MKRFAVAIMAVDDGEIELQVISAENWREAVMQHNICPWEALAEPDDSDDDDDDDTERPSVIPDDINAAIDDAADQGYAFALIEIT